MPTRKAAPKAPPERRGLVGLTNEELKFIKWCVLEMPDEELGRWRTPSGETSGPALQQRLAARIDLELMQRSTKATRKLRDELRAIAEDATPKGGVPKGKQR